MAKYVRRYKDIFGMSIPSNNVPSFVVTENSTDIYINYSYADRLDNIAGRIYGAPEFYWVILDANGYSAEFEIEPGEILRIPYPLERVIDDIRKQSK